MIESSDKEIEIHSATTGEFIISYRISLIKGKHITKPELARTTKADPSEAEKALAEVFDTTSSKDLMHAYLNMIKEKQPGYYNASVRILLRVFGQLPKSMTETVLHQTHADKVTNAYGVAEIANALLVRNGHAPLKDTPAGTATGAGSRRQPISRLTRQTSKTMTD